MPRAGRLRIKHIRTKPHTPQTNGKAERFIETALGEWALRPAFEHSDQHRQALLPWLHRYNWHRLMLASTKTTHHRSRPNRERPLEASHLTMPA